mmetsp:Transcript_16817/g.25279  ORF Transcript_16817/g.25279 Transcript_16817/m.25279 type:complete len:460 (+) Transcript_16817:135-1514(+)
MLLILLSWIGLLLSVQSQTTSTTTIKQANCVKFKKIYEGVKSDNVHMDCVTPDNREVCCAAQGDLNPVREPRGIGYEKIQAIPQSSFKNSKNGKNSKKKNISGKCHITRTYIPSPYETHHMRLASVLESISDPNQRLNELLRQLTTEKELSQNYKWLELAREIMQSPEDKSQWLQDNDASSVLSRFNVVKTCKDSTYSWIEWIEPITVHGRHPFAFAACRHIKAVVDAYPNVNSHQELLRRLNSGRNVDERIASDVPIMSSDYLILSTNHMTYGNNGSTLMLRGRNKHVLYDAGTSLFDSSLKWLTCAYSQVGMSFDKVLSWEKSLLDPVEYWSRIPLKWQPFWSFYNTPIGTSNSTSPSPTAFIRRTSRPADFISFKLDIDHPETELDLAVELLNDQYLIELVDEFFFEAHFRCDVMMACGWGTIKDTEKRQIVLDRLPVMQFFQKVRHNGIRSHFWP